MNNMHLPRELVAFLSAAKKLDYDPSRIEPGVVGLKSLDQLEMGVVRINSDEPDWILIYTPKIDILLLERTGTQADLFGK